MTRRRWIADEVTGDHAALVGEHADHLVRVLRARVGEDFDIVAGEAVRRGRITSLKNDRVEFELGEPVIGSQLFGLNPPSVTLVLAIFKFDRLEWAIEKCTELGVTRMVPVIARRTDAHLAASSGKRVERWQRIARQAAEQSRRSEPPVIASPTKLSDYLNSAVGRRIVLDESENKNLLRDVLTSPSTDPEVTLAIGPEGGWTEGEIQSFRQAGWISASLGNTILRAETAAIAATAIVISTLVLV